jgi:hypothetical protein
MVVLDLVVHLLTSPTRSTSDLYPSREDTAGSGH